MESRSAAIAPLSHLGRTARWTTQRRCLSSAHPPWGRVACSRSPIYLFTMPIWLFTMTDPGVHLAPIRAFTLDRSECSPWTETRKSRIVYEFTHSHRTQDWLILEAGSVSYGKATSYLPVSDLLKAYFKIHDRETLREIREKVTGKLLTLDESLKSALPAVL